MLRSNNKVDYSQVVVHQAQRRDALSMGQVPVDEPIHEPSLNSFLWVMFGILVSLIAVLWYVQP